MIKNTIFNELMTPKLRQLSHTRIQRGSSGILTCDSRSHVFLRHYSNSNGRLQRFYGDKNSVQ